MRVSGKCCSFGLCYLPCPRIFSCQQVPLFLPLVFAWCFRFSTIVLNSLGSKLSPGHILLPFSYRQLESITAFYIGSSCNVIAFSSFFKVLWHSPLSTVGICYSNCLGEWIPKARILIREIPTEAFHHGRKQQYISAKLNGCLTVGVLRFRLRWRGPRLFRDLTIIVNNLNWTWNGRQFSTNNTTVPSL